MSGVTQAMIDAGKAVAVNPVSTAANLATAKEAHATLGQDIKVVGAWLYATSSGAFKSIEEAIEHILK